MSEFIYDGEIGVRGFLRGTLSSSSCPNGWKEMGKESGATISLSAEGEMEGSALCSAMIHWKGSKGTR